MPTPGRYDTECERLLSSLEADACALIVLNGRNGAGMSVSIDPSKANAPLVRLGLPALLRRLADLIEAAQGSGEPS